MNARPAPGLVLVRKAVGATSFSVVEAVRRDLSAMPGKAWKVCHGGALDPFAEGLLPVLVGPATKLFERLHEVPKVYEAVVRWGVETDTGDPAGAVVARGDACRLTPATLDEGLAAFRGWQLQTPPATSNKRVDGERAWRRAHRGERFELPPSRVYLHEARWLWHELPDRSRLRLVVGGGFYVRSLVRDLGRALTVPAHLGALDRVAIGPWRCPPPGVRLDVQGPDVVPWYERLELRDDEWGEVKRGVERLALAGPRRPAPWRVPSGFPSPSSLVVGLHRGRVVALFEAGTDAYRVQTRLLPPL